jgi:ribosomal protein L37AE/L43A
MKQRCENCNKVSEEVVTRYGFIMTFYIEWVCRKCFEKLEGISFEEYSKVDYEKSNPSKE